MSDKLNFVQRYLRPSSYPRIKNRDGSYSTHRMAWAEADGKYYAYPTIVMEDNELVELNARDAWDYAIKNKEYIVFDTPEEASDYAEGGYKKRWAEGEQEDSGVY